MMSTDQNKALIARYVDEKWNHQNDAVIDELLGEGMDVVAARSHFHATHVAFGDVRFTIDNLIAEDDTVILRWTSNSIHQGAIRNFAPTGQRITFHGLAEFRVVDGKILSDDGFSDLFDVLLQSG